MEPVIFLTSYGTSVLANITTSVVEKIAHEVKPKSLESLFIKTFLLTLDYHDKYYDKVSRKFTTQLRMSIKKDRIRLLHIFARNSDNLQTFLAPIKKRQFQKKVAQEIVKEFSLDSTENDGIVLFIVMDCLELYQRAFLEQMSQQQALQSILIQALKIDSVIELLEEMKSKLDLSLLGRRPNFPIDQIKIKVSLSKLPTTGHDLFGRDEEIETLDKAWADEHTNILSFVAWGGVGKTALVNEWLNQMGLANYRGAGRIYGWSFYSQGTREERLVSADEFLAYALEWFGDADPKEGSPWDKGIRLAELVRQQMTLLILDGLEPLQYPPGPMKGQLKDQGLQALLKELARSNPGLCIITTREKVKDLEHVDESALRCVFLENLSEEAGVKLLKNLGVKKGTDEELRKAVEDFNGHALALNLLGTYLSTVHDGEIRKRDLVPRLTDEEEQGGHAKRVMRSYEIWLKGRPELEILYMMGLFDRPAPGGAIDALLGEPAIEGLTDKMQKLSEAKWQYALKHLRELRLLAKRDENEPDKLDCHPLIREHFGEKLQNQNPEAWKEAHSRLYEYYKGVPKKKYPDTLEEMEPLFSAVSHGCYAGWHIEALEQIYLPRIQRGGCLFSDLELGAYGADLSALAGFFNSQWGRLVDRLTEDHEEFILNQIGFVLRALGRLTEAVEVLKDAMQAGIRSNNWQHASRAAYNLSGLHLILGEITRAVDYAEQNLDLAERSIDPYWKMANLTALGDALHQSGQLEDAEEVFLQADALFNEAKIGRNQDQSKYPLLYSFRCYRYYDLLVSRGKYRNVL